MSELTSKTESRNMEMIEDESMLPEIIEPSDPPEVVQVEDIPSRILAIERRIESYSGPLPQPKHLRQYENVVPGAANRILEMAESEASHRHSFEKEMLRIESRDSLLGIFFATILCAGTIIAGVTIAINVPSLAGTIVGGLVGTSGLVSVFGVMIRTTRTSWQIQNKKPPSSSADSETAIGENEENSQLK
ncbi:MAG: DUF2335 domain-containing protein [Mogibacterium sp.]|nr:DUF2335 domain-containing protein [Mogibacterium sp.]